MSLPRDASVHVPVTVTKNPPNNRTPFCRKAYLPYLEKKQTLRPRPPRGRKYGTSDRALCSGFGEGGLAAYQSECARNTVFDPPPSFAPKVRPKMCQTGRLLGGALWGGGILQKSHIFGGKIPFDLGTQVPILGVWVALLYSKCNSEPLLFVNDHYS